jgi:hypothetical protein
MGKGEGGRFLAGGLIMAKQRTADRFTKYSHLMTWAWKRYQNKNGRVIISTNGKLSTYSRIEDAAFQKYIRHPRDDSGVLIFAN